MKPRGPAPGWAWVFWFLSIVCTLVCIFVTVTFTTHNTKWVESFHLSDPAHSEGQFFGTLVAWPLTLSLIFGVYWFHRHVLSQLGAYTQAFILWERVLERHKVDPETGKPGRLDPKAAEELVQSIAGLQPSYARVVRAAQSWRDPSPDSDAEMVIEGIANRCRQHLSLLQAIASILVLIGLVGNFFGLSAAVQGMSGLTEISQPTPAASTSPSSSPQPTPDQNGNFEQTYSDNPTPSASTTAVTNIDSITSGLKVVVVSSVLGIGGMIVLLLFVAIFRNFFNHLVGEEVLLIATEIGAAVRPGSDGSGIPDPEAFQKNLTDLNLTLDNLGQRLAEFEAKDRDLGKLTGQLDEVLREHLRAEDTKFVELKKTLGKLHENLEARDQTLAGVLEASLGTGRQLETIATNMNRVGTHLTKMVESQQKTLLDFETYAGLVRSMASEQNDRLEARHRELVETLARQLEQPMQGWLQKMDQERQALTRRTQEVLERSEQSQKKLLDKVLEDLDRQSESMRELQKELVQKSQIELQAVRSAAKSQTDSFLEKLEKLEERSEQAWTESAGSFKAESEQLRTALERGLGTVTQALEAKLPEAAQALQSVSDTVVESQRKVHEELTRSVEVLGQLAENQKEATSASRSVLDEAGNVLSQTRDRILELQDRWSVNVEETAREVFHQWHEHQTPEGALAAEVRGLSEKLAELIELQRQMPVALQKMGEPQPIDDRRACPGCGLANAAREPYCTGCGHTMEHAAAPGSFPVRLLTDRLDSLQKVLETKLSESRPAEIAKVALDTAFVDRIEAALANLKVSLEGHLQPVALPTPSQNGHDLVVERLDKLIGLIEEDRNRSQAAPAKPRGWGFLTRRDG